MIRQPPPLPGRQRTPSGHDIPIPESVFQAIAAVQNDNRATRAEVAGLRDDVKETNRMVKSLAARRNSSMADLAKIIVPAVVAILGGGRLLAPSPEPTRTEVRYTPVDPRMAECRGLQPGTQAQGECFARVQAEIQSGKPATP
jgi:hypothetical protein